MEFQFNLEDCAILVALVQLGGLCHLAALVDVEGSCHFEILLQSEAYVTLELDNDSALNSVIPNFIKNKMSSLFCFVY